MEGVQFAGLNRVLLLEADPEDRRTLQLLLGEEGCQVAAAGEVDAGLRELEARGYDAVFCSLGLLRGANGLAAQLASPDGPLLIVLASPDEREGALEAADGLAWDFLQTPATSSDVAMALRRASRFVQLRRSSAFTVPDRPSAPADPTGSMLAGMVGASPAMQAVFRTIKKVAQHKVNVLITGESGTGKELVARAMHSLGERKDQPFVAINCGAIPESLLESELFGHVRGAFTDAVRDKSGLFEEADGGTLFLDEIGELSPKLQVKLLRAIQEEEIRRIGGNTSIHIDVRVISATLLDLGEACRTGRFREDLFYRLNVLPLALPPLRERREDIPLLAEYFLHRYADKHSAAGTTVESVSDEAMRLFCDYTWPGNIRELENTIERALVLCEGPVIEADLLEEKLRARRDPIRESLASDELSIKKTSRVVEEELIRRALDATGGNRTNAAKLLEISHRALLYKIKEYGL